MAIDNIPGTIGCLLKLFYSLIICNALYSNNFLKFMKSPAVLPCYQRKIVDNSLTPTMYKDVKINGNG
jgi:hypothetical protein